MSVVITETAEVTFTGFVDPDTSTVTASPSSVAADGIAYSTITVTLRDTLGNPIPGITVSLSHAMTGGGIFVPHDTIHIIDTVTDAAGVVTFTVTDGVPEMVTYTATDVTDSLVITETADVEFTLVIGGGGGGPGSTSGVGWIIEAAFDGVTYEIINRYANTQGFTASVTRSTPFGGDLATSQVNLTLRNVSSDWSLRNINSSWYGFVKWRVPFRIRCNLLSTDYNLWTGYIVDYSFKYLPGDASHGTVTITAQDLLSLVASQTVTVGYSESGAATPTLASSAQFNDVLRQALGDPLLSSDVKIVGSDFKTGTFYISEAETNVGSALKDIALSDLNGYIFCDRDGAINYHSRNQRLGTTLDSAPNQTIGDSSNIKVQAIEEVMDNKVYNKAEATSTVITLGANANKLLVYKAPLGVDAGDGKGRLFAPGESWKFIVKPNQPNIQALVGDAVCERNNGFQCSALINGEYEPLETTKLRVVITDKYELTVTNISPTSTYLIKLYVYCDAITNGVTAKNSEKNPGTNPTDDSAIGTVSWTSPALAVNENTAFTSIGLGIGETSHYLKCVNFGFNIPKDATITGINAKVKLKGAVSFGSYGQIFGSLIVGGVIAPLPDLYPSNWYKAGLIYHNSAGDPYSDVPLPTVLTFVSWEINLPNVTFEDVNATDFGIAIVAYTPPFEGGMDIDIDVVDLVIYYTTPDAQNETRTTKKNEIKSLQTLPSIGDVKGGGTYSVTLAFNADPKDALNLAMEKLRIYRYPFTRLSLTVKWAHDDAILGFLNYIELGSLIRYTDIAEGSASYSDDFYRVESIKHTIGPNIIPVTVLTLIPSYQYRDPTKLVWDDFDRADVADDLKKTPTGQTWTIDVGNWQILDNKARPSSTLQSRVWFELNSSDLIAEVSLSNMSSDDNEQVGLLYRFVDSDNYWIAIVQQDIDSVIIAKKVAGISTVYSAAYTPADTAELRVIVQGDRHRFFVNERFVLEVSDSDLNDATKVGFYSANTTTVDFNNVYAEAI